MIRIASLMVTLVTLAACVPQSRAPAQVQPPQPVQRHQPVQQMRPAPAPVAAPALPAPRPSASWLDARLTPGAWSYRAAGPGNSAAFFGPGGAPLFTIRCEPGRRVSLIRNGGSGTLSLRTSTTSRALAVAPAAGGPAATLGADDPLLDALAFSRGRFAVEAAGAAPLVVPAWPELARVVEDCRR